MRGSLRRNRGVGTSPARDAPPPQHITVQAQQVVDFKITINPLTANSALYRGWRIQLHGVLNALYGLDPAKAREYWDTLNKRTPSELSVIAPDKV